MPDSKYMVTSDYFPPLADIPLEGAGVLIEPRWVVTAAHATQWQSEPIKSVTIAGKARAVDRVFVNPGWRRVPLDEGGSEESRMTPRLNNDDIALLRLAEPVIDVKPAVLYRGSAEAGHLIEIIGKGQDGTGRDGIAADAPHRNCLRRAENHIETADGKWLTYRFDSPQDALPLEGIFGGGDSGGPVILRDQGTWKLAGLTSWGWYKGHLAIGVDAGRYGETAYLVRISHYADWIENTMKANSK